MKREVRNGTDKPKHMGTVVKNRDAFPHIKVFSLIMKKNMTRYVRTGVQLHNQPKPYRQHGAALVQSLCFANRQVMNRHKKPDCV